MTTPDLVLVRIRELEGRFEDVGNNEAALALRELHRSAMTLLYGWAAGVEAKAEAVKAEARAEAARYRALRERSSAIRRGLARRGAPTPTVILTGPDQVAVYALVDPDAPDVIRYVGQSVSPHSRYRGHLRNLGWARDLVKVYGRYPMMLLIEWCADGLIAHERERHWIHHYREMGMADLNVAIAPKAWATRDT